MHFGFLGCSFTNTSSDARADRAVRNSIFLVSHGAASHLDDGGRSVSRDEQSRETASGQRQ